MEIGRQPKPGREVTTDKIAAIKREYIAAPKARKVEPEAVEGEFEIIDVADQVEAPATP